MCVTFVTCAVRVCGPRCHSGSSLYIYRVYLLPAGLQATGNLQGSPAPQPARCVAACYTRACSTRCGVALARGVAAAHACCGLAATHARVPPGPGVGRRRWPNDRCISRRGPLRPDFAGRVRRQQREWLVAHTPRADSLARAVRGALPRVSELQLCVLLEGEGHFASPCSSNPNLYSLETQPSPRPSLILNPNPNPDPHSTAASSQP